MVYVFANFVILEYLLHHISSGQSVVLTERNTVR